MNNNIYTFFDLSRYLLFIYLTILIFIRVHKIPRFNPVCADATGTSGRTPRIAVSQCCQLYDFKPQSPNNNQYKIFGF